MTAPGIDLRADGAESEMRLTFQRRHDAEWTERQRRGWKLELGKLEAQLPPHREPARTILLKLRFNLAQILPPEGSDV